MSNLPKLFESAPYQGGHTGIEYFKFARGFHAMCFDPGCWRDWDGLGGRGVWITEPCPTIERARALAKDHCIAEGHKLPAVKP